MLRPACCLMHMRIEMSDGVRDHNDESTCAQAWLALQPHLFTIATAQSLVIVNGSSPNDLTAELPGQHTFYIRTLGIIHR